VGDTGPELILDEGVRETQQENSWAADLPDVILLPGRIYWFQLRYCLQSTTQHPVAFFIKISDGILEVLTDVIYAGYNWNWLMVTWPYTIPSGWKKPGITILAYKDPPRPDDDVFFEHASLKEWLVQRKIQYLPLMGVG
jgi:hypothetical protein